MSHVKNTEGATAGSIYRIFLSNFVTYKQVELYPCQTLNLIIGPNATGKSTFLSAVVLGLCGKPSVLDKAKKISEYIRIGCEEATIQIELYQKKGQRNVVITRTFNNRCISYWYVDNQPVAEKKVQQLIASLNIKVDNLCQLLPQNRVEDFAKMNTHSLLKSTLLAVNGEESLNQMESLIALRSKQKTLSTTLKNSAQQLSEKKRLNERLRTVIDTMNQKKELEAEIAMCEKKKLWAEYKDIRTKVEEHKENEKKARELVSTHEKKMAPLKKAIENAKMKIDKFVQEKTTISREIQGLRGKVDETISSVNLQDLKLKEAEMKLKEKQELHDNRERDLRKAKITLDKLLTDKQSLTEKIGDPETLKRDYEALKINLATTNAGIEKLKKGNLDISSRLDSVRYEMKSYQHRIQDLEDVKSKRLEALKTNKYGRQGVDTYKAIMWLRDEKNRQMFQHNVYEPMMFEINFTDPKFARYLECTVPRRDLFAFTFESSEDMNTFLKVRQENRWQQVNAVCSSGSMPAHRDNIDQLSYLGFYTYLIDTIVAPEAIVKYLCQQYGIHRIPIGNEHTYNNSENVINIVTKMNISFFFTENHRITVRVSKYSGKKSSSTIEINDANLLHNTLNMDRINEYRSKLVILENKKQSYEEDMKRNNANLTTLGNQLSEFNNRRNNFNEKIEKTNSLNAQIRAQRAKVSDIENEPLVDMQRERRKCREAQRECVLKQCKLHADLCSLMNHLHAKILAKEICSIRSKVRRDDIVKRESEMRAVEEEFHSAQSTLGKIEEVRLNVETNARRKLSEARSACNSNKLPQEDGFPYRSEFAKLPKDLNSLQEHIYTLQMSISYMDKGDAQVIKEYELREKEIEKLEREVNETSERNRDQEEELNKLKQKWLVPLNDLIAKVDRSFGEMFKKLGCAGEVKLSKGGSEDDYDQYGISIMVKFRNAEQLSQLDGCAHSGGERSLSTALYLLALQTLATVPFRWVDEINQGMDAINERKMLQELIQITTEVVKSQYFLLTPKLLNNLEFNDKVMVHTVMNGHDIMKYDQWDFKKFLQRARSEAGPSKSARRS